MSTKNNALIMIALVAVAVSAVAIASGLQKSTLGDILVPVAVSPIAIIPDVPDGTCIGCAGSAMDKIQITARGSIVNDADIPPSPGSQRSPQSSGLAPEITTRDGGSTG